MGTRQGRALIEPTEDMECPECGEEIPVRAEICPHCELELL